MLGGYGIWRFYTYYKIYNYGYPLAQSLVGYRLPLPIEFPPLPQTPKETQTKVYLKILLGERQHYTAIFKIADTKQMTERQPPVAKAARVAWYFYPQPCCRSNAHATCSRTKDESSRARASSAAIASSLLGEFPKATAILRNHCS